MAQEGDGAPSVEYSSTSIHPRPPTVRVASHRRALSFALLSLSGSRWHITADWAHRKTVAKPVKPRPAPTQPTTSDYVDEHWAITNERESRPKSDGHALPSPLLPHTSCQNSRLFDFRRVPIERHFLFLLWGWGEEVAVSSCMPPIIRHRPPPHLHLAINGRSGRFYIPCIDRISNLAYINQTQ